MASGTDWFSMSREKEKEGSEGERRREGGRREERREGGRRKRWA